MRYLFILAAALALSAACQNPSETAATKDSTLDKNHFPDTTAQSFDTVKAVVLHNGIHCFAYIKNRDTIYMQLTLQDTAVGGKLVYNLYGKDKNNGMFKGRLRNDTLLAIYTFSSEGMRSVRQVVFLLKGNILLQGNGSMKEQNGKLVFSNKSDISFDGNTILEPMDCGSALFK